MISIASTITATMDIVLIAIVRILHFPAMEITAISIQIVVRAFVLKTFVLVVLEVWNAMEAIARQTLIAIQIYVSYMMLQMDIVQLVIIHRMVSTASTPFVMKTMTVSQTIV